MRREEKRGEEKETRRKREEERENEKKRGKTRRREGKRGEERENPTPFEPCTWDSLFEGESFFFGAGFSATSTVPS